MRLSGVLGGRAALVSAVLISGSAGGGIAHAASLTIYSTPRLWAAYDEAGNLRPGLYANGDLWGFPPNEPTRAIMEFPLAALPANIVVDSAKFEYYPGAVTVPQRDRLGFYGYSGDGAPTAADYAAGTLLHQNASTVAMGVYNSVDVTAFVQGLVAADATHAGIVARNNTTEATTVNIYTSYFPPYYFSAPRLVVEYSDAPVATTPLPSAAGAGGVMLTGLMLRRARRRD